MDIIIKKLEEQISFLQNEVNQMSDEIFTQQKEILDLKKEILLLKEKIDSIETNVEKETGMNTLQYVTEKTMDTEIRECETIHSAEINQIFFETLDVIDCKIHK